MNTPLSVRNGPSFTPVRTPFRTPFRPRSKSIMEPVEVFCRIKPPTNDDDEICIRVLDDFTIQFTTPASRLQADSGVSKEMLSRFTFAFDKTTNQKMVFDRVAYELVDDLLHGKNGLLFTYGITGSGKTYTMTGTPENIGILPRCLDVIFNSIVNCQANRSMFVPDKANGFYVQSELSLALEKQRAVPATPAPKTSGSKSCQTEVDSEWELRPRSTEPMRIRGIDEDNAYAVFVSYVEIYNNYVYDLLDTPTERFKSLISKPLREDANRNMYISNVIEVEVKSTEEAFAVFARGQRLRRVAHTLLNTESSRSHSVFNIRVVQSPLDETGNEVLKDRDCMCVSQLALVDLAGSERTKRTGHVGDRIRETGCINNSLMVLRQCIEQLRNNQKAGGDKLVPYRDSRLTHLFKNYFDGDGKVRMIVCLNPSAVDFDENLHVMQFAELTQEVEVPRSIARQQDAVDGLTPGRRRAAAMLKELSESFEFKSIVTSTRLFDSLPSLNFYVSSPDEMERVLLQLISHRDVLLQQSFDIDSRVQKQAQVFKENVAKLAVANRTMLRQLEESKHELHTLEKDKRRLETELGGAKSHLYNLEYRLSRYDRDAKVMMNQEELMKRREREMAARERLKDEKLLAVKEIVDRSHALRPWQYRSSSIKLNRNQGRRGPSPPPKPRPRQLYRRRSKSTDALNGCLNQGTEKPDTVSGVERMIRHTDCMYIDDQVEDILNRKRSSEDETVLSEEQDEKRSKH